MTLTAEERREISRENGRKSRGPATEEGKIRSRQNASKHGLRAEVLALPDEDPEVVHARQEAWLEHYRPGSPAAQHLVNQCVQATLLADRCHAYHHAALSGQIRQAEELWERRRIDEVGRLADLLRDEPAAAVRLLKRSGHGCRWLIGRWERLGRLLDERGYWGAEDRGEAIRLLGFHPGSEDGPGATTAADGPSPGSDRKLELDGPRCDGLAAEAVAIHLFDRICRPDPSGPSEPWPLEPSRLPDPLPGPEAALEALRAVVDEQLAALRREEEWLRREVDGPDRAEAAALASILRDPVEARLFLRYHTEARTAFQRAHRELERVMQTDLAAAGGASPAAGTPPPGRVATAPAPPTGPGFNVREVLLDAYLAGLPSPSGRRGGGAAGPDAQAPAPTETIPPVEPEPLTSLEFATEEPGPVAPGDVPGPVPDAGTVVPSAGPDLPPVRVVSPNEPGIDPSTSPWTDLPAAIPAPDAGA